MTPRHFRTPAEFRRWLEAHHATEKELWVGFYKVKSGKGGMVYRQALDEALCCGWIDGMLKRVDEDVYVQRFTPRRADSTWSLVNLRRANELIEEGRMRPAGLAALERRRDGNAGVSSFEQRRAGLSAAYAKRLAQNTEASAFFESQPESYRHVASWWVMSAKKAETRERRLAALIEDSAAGRRIRAARVEGREASPLPGSRRVDSAR